LKSSTNTYQNLEKRDIAVDFLMGGSVSRWVGSSCLKFFSTYSAVKEIEVRNTYIGVIYRVIQFVVIAYIAM
jgi:hypothetical protein